jgi:hypothetical protein
VFSRDWLENLLVKLDDKTLITSKLIERHHPRFGVFPDSLNGTGAFEKNFGDNISTFREDEFNKFVEIFKQNKVTLGGAYMPCVLYKKDAYSVGLFPEGNIAGKSFDNVVNYGDIVFFKKMSDIGIHHKTTWDSIVYHFKEGERDD